MFEWIALIAAGLVLGRILRILTPYFLGVKDKATPFSTPWVEVYTAGLFTIICLEKGSVFPDYVHWYLFSLILVAITSTDMLFKLIPDKLSLGGALTGIICSAVFPHEIIGFLSHDALLVVFPELQESPALAGLCMSVLGAAIGFLGMELIRKTFSSMANMQVMGMGDSKIMLLVGAYIGPQMVVYALLPSCLVGIAGSLVYSRVTKTPHAPFGPALALGSILTLLYHEHIFGAITAFQTGLQNLSPFVLLGISLGLIAVLILLFVRLRSRAADYSRLIEEDYEEIEKKLE